MDLLLKVLFGKLVKFWV